MGKESKGDRHAYSGGLLFVILFFIFRERIALLIIASIIPVFLVFLELIIAKHFVRHKSYLEHSDWELLKESLGWGLAGTLLLLVIISAFFGQ